ncbi:hypothetical protein ACS0TY_008156 [Phlomoides rotata]
MAITRLVVRLKCINASFREWASSDMGRKNEAVFFEALRSFGTSNDVGGEECHAKEPIARRKQEEIVNALHLGERSRASQLLTEFGNSDRALKVQSFFPIFEYCSRTPDPLFAMETWKLMMEKDIKLSGICYFFTIKALCKGGYLEEAFGIISVLRENSDIHPTLPVYNNLLKACVRMKSLKYASECLQLMKQDGVGHDIFTYTYLLELAVLQQDVSVVHEIWRECVNRHSLDIITLQKFVWSFTSLRDVASAYMALQQMVSVAFQCKRNKEKESNKGVRFGIEAKEVGDDGLSFSGQPLSGTVKKLLGWSFDAIIHACASTHNILLAEELMSQMQDLGLEPSSGAYDGLIKGLVYVKGFHDGMEVLKVMLQKNIKPKDSTLAMLSESCSRGLELDLAETLLDQISKYNHVKVFSELLEACDNLDQPERGLRVLAKLKYLKLMPDIRTYELLFSLFGNVNVPYEDANSLSQADAAKRINAIEMDMMKNGIQHSHLSMHNLLRALGTEGMKEEMFQYLNSAENQFFYRNAHLGIEIYNTVLHSLVEAKETRMTIEIFKKMISCGFSPDAATYTIMIDCCGIIKCYRSACALISLLIREGFCMNVVTYTTVIKILLSFEAFDEAFKLLYQACSEGVQPDLLLYNAFLRAADEKGRIDVIELIVEMMHQDKIQPDPSTCGHVFSAYVNKGFYSTALEALQVVSLRMISEEDDGVEECRLKYEDLILNEHSVAQSQIMKIFKDSPFLAVALLNLRWCAMILSTVSWFPNRSLWAKRLSSEYTSRHRG